MLRRSSSRVTAGWTISPANTLRQSALTLNQRQGNWAKARMVPMMGSRHRKPPQVVATNVATSAPAAKVAASQRCRPIRGHARISPMAAKISATTPNWKPMGSSGPLRLMPKPHTGLNNWKK